MAHDVFISYASSDKVVADAVCSQLESIHRIRCWIAPRDGDWLILHRERPLEVPPG